MGVAAALIYCMNATVWYESTAKVMVSQKDPGLATGVSGGNLAADEILNQDILANHMEIVSSRKIVQNALRGANLESLPSISKRKSLQPRQGRVETKTLSIQCTSGRSQLELGNIPETWHFGLLGGGMMCA